MAMQMDRIGHFRGPIVAAALNKAKETKSKFIAIKASVEDWWNPNTKKWEDWRSYEMEAIGSICIVKKDGTIHESQAEAMLNYAGWDGDFASLGENCNLKPIRFSTNKREYVDSKGIKVETYEIDWINDYSTDPPTGLKSNVDEGDVRSLNAEFGAQLRALKGNAQRNAAKPAGRPATPPINTPAAVGEAVRAQGDIPF